jgi:hypothetical protein
LLNPSVELFIKERNGDSGERLVHIIGGESLGKS